MDAQVYSNLHWPFNMHIHMYVFSRSGSFFSFRFFFVAVLLFFGKMNNPCFTFNHVSLSWR